MRGFAVEDNYQNLLQTVKFSLQISGQMDDLIKTADPYKIF